MPATWTSPSGSRWEPAPGADAGPFPGPVPEQPAATPGPRRGSRGGRRGSRALVAVVALLGLGGLGAGALAYEGTARGQTPAGPAASTHDQLADGPAGEGDHHRRGHR